jgi:hypothetical protein
MQGSALPGRSCGRTGWPRAPGVLKDRTLWESCGCLPAQLGLLAAPGAVKHRLV